jgi:hypothetical protein
MEAAITRNSRRSRRLIHAGVVPRLTGDVFRDIEALHDAASRRPEGAAIFVHMANRLKRAADLPETPIPAGPMSAKGPVSVLVQALQRIEVDGPEVEPRYPEPASTEAAEAYGLAAANYEAAEIAREALRAVGASPLERRPPCA